MKLIRKVFVIFILFASLSQGNAQECTTELIHPVNGSPITMDECLDDVVTNCPFCCLEEWTMDCQRLYDQCSETSAISSFIHVDQFGYRPNAHKVAVLTNPMVGYNAFLDYAPGTEIQLIDVADNSVVFTGIPEEQNEGNLHELSGDMGWWFDFTEFQTPGVYVVYDQENDQRSAEFEIKQDVFKDVLKEACRMFYYNRSGMAKVTPFADDAWVDEVSFENPGQHATCRNFFDQDNVSLEKDLSGGWFDAGDYNKYVTYTESTIHNLLWAYIENPTVFTDDWNIPESGNGVPDILDEIKWELDWLMKMNNLDGSTHLKLGSLTHDDNSSAPPSTNTDPVFYINTCSSAEIAVSSIFAHAALVFQSIDGMEDYALELESRAITTWNYVLPDLVNNTLDDNCDNYEVVSGDADWSLSKQRAVAVTGAIYLFDLTNDETYNTYVIENMEDTENIESDSPWSAYTPHLAEAKLHYASMADADVATVNDFMNLYSVYIIDDYSEALGLDNPGIYRSNMPDWAYHTGSNLPKAGFGILNLVAEKSNLQIEQNANFLAAAEDYLHYFHGVNPLGMVMLTNMYPYGAEHAVDEMFHLWFQDDSPWDNLYSSEYGPPPGYVIGGPNGSYLSYQDTPEPSPPAGQPVMKSYWSFNDFFYPSPSITEPAIYYQAAYIRLLSTFVQNAPAVGIGENEENIYGFEVYPNPSNDHVNIKLNDDISGEFLIQLFDAKGNIVIEETRSNYSGGNELTFNFKGVAAGSYILTIGKFSRTLIIN